MTSLPLSPLGTEALDTPDCPDDVARATLADIARSNRLFGGRRAAWLGVRHLLRDAEPGRPLTLLDVGSGSGDISRYVGARAAARGVPLETVGLDFHAAAAALCRRAGTRVIVADVNAVPLRPGTVDIVLASQFLHHFARPAVIELVRRFTALAGRGVVITEPRRSAVAARGILLAGSVLRFHPATQHDGTLSVRRSFTSAELRSLLREAGIVTPVHRRAGFRLVAAWRTDAHD